MRVAHKIVLSGKGWGESWQGNAMARILVIDDERLVRDTIRVMLEFEGHDVVLAREGQAGIRELRSGFDLVICDISAPNRAGLQTTTPIVAMTGGSAEVLETRLDSELHDIAGRDDIILALAKPFRRAELMGLVKRCLG
jgi:CheY-like chemotaxis protein